MSEGLEGIEQRRAEVIARLRRLHRGPWWKPWAWGKPREFSKRERERWDRDIESVRHLTARREALVEMHATIEALRETTP